MSETRYPNESAAYRSARDKLLEEERKLVEQTKAVADVVWVDISANRRG